MRRHVAAVALALLAGCTTEKTVEKLVSPPGCTANADCDDGVYCNGAETCTLATGTCARGTAPSCDDSVACTVDVCDDAQRTCVHVPSSSACGFGERCTATGCGPAPQCATNADCDDGLFCNGAESCGLDQRCHPGTAPACDDSVACTVDFCDDLLDRCAHVGDAWACAAGERCSPTAGCVTPAECGADADCDDRVFCNGTETCDLVTGRCKPGLRPDCDDGFACTADVCDELLARCVSVPDATRCAAGQLCLPAQGCVTPAACAADPECDDGVFCNGAETCDSGTGRCAAGTPPACGDAVACNVDLCDEARRACVHLDEPATAGCTLLSVVRAGTGTGTVTSAPAAIACGTSCTAWLEPSVVVTLSAAADSSSTFAGWGGGCAGVGTCALPMTAARSVTATFDRMLYVLSVSGTGGGTVTSDPAGVYCGATCGASFGAGTTVRLTASAEPSGTFAGWSGACSGTSATCDVSMTSAKAVSARFTFPLTVSRAGIGAGTVSSLPFGISCGSTCGVDFTGGTTVTLTATPDATSTFAGWTGACSGTATCTVTLDAARSVTATFARNYLPLTVSREGSGGGRVTSSPAGIDCGTTCSGSYVGGTLVTLTASADANSTFAGWTGACSGTGACAVTLDAAKTVGATFTRSAFALTIARSGEGTVSSTPGGVYCGADCAETFAAGSVVVLEAAPATGWTFLGWGGGACTGTSSCTVTMTAARSVSATFTRDNAALTVTRSGAGGGTVTSSPSGILCGGTCSTLVPAGTVVALEAAPDGQSVFTGWSGACTGTGTCVVTVNAASAVNAQFDKTSFPVTVSKAGTGGGTVTSSPAGITCGSTCSGTYQAGSVVRLTAAPDGTSDFTGWTGACTGTATTCDVTVDGAKTTAATFTRRVHTLTVSRSGGGSVTSAPGGISCGATCAAGYDEGTLVTLTATPDAGNSFAGWTGACTGPFCTVTMNAAKSVTASFMYGMTVTKAGDGRGTVSASPGGFVCDDSCIMGSTAFSPGTYVTLTATPAPGSTFAGWTGVCAGLFSCSFTADGAKSVTAMFLKQRYDLLVVKTGTGGGTVTSAPAGISCGGACLATFDAPTSVTLTATGDATSDFAGWAGACTGTGTCTVTMDGTKGVAATFTRRQRTLAVTRVGPGDVGSSPAGISCGAGCAASYDEGTVVALTAVPQTGAAFMSWAGDCTGSGACSVAMTSARAVTAKFGYPVTVSLAGGGGGTVTSAPAGLSCTSGPCTATFDQGTSVTLTAAAAPGMTFWTWTGCDSVAGTSCTVAADRARSVSATFAVPLTVTRTNGGGGTVTSSQGGLACGGACNVSYVYGTVAVLSGTPNPGGSFGSWTGCDSTSGNSCTVAMTSVRIVNARFTMPLSVTIAGTGSVSSSPAGIAGCSSGTCAASFDYGQPVTLTATTGGTFSGWVGSGCSGTGTCSVSTTSPLAVTATFTP